MTVKIDVTEPKIDMPISAVENLNSRPNNELAKLPAAISGEEGEQWPCFAIQVIPGSTGQGT